MEPLSGATGTILVDLRETGAGAGSAAGGSGSGVGLSGALVSLAGGVRRAGLRWTVSVLMWPRRASAERRVAGLVLRRAELRTLRLDLWEAAWRAGRCEALAAATLL